LNEHGPDLLWIDPALSYLGGEANSQKDVGGFLRNHLNPLLREFNCAVVVVHHTNKPPAGREKPDWSGGGFAYLGGGSAEWANWARAVLVVRSLGSVNSGATIRSRFPFCFLRKSRSLNLAVVHTSVLRLSRIVLPLTLILP
jgi:hypothetical protein